MLRLSRFGKHFDVSGEKETHFGAFTCGDTLAAVSYREEDDAASCC